MLAKKFRGLCFRQGRMKSEISKRTLGLQQLNNHGLSCMFDINYFGCVHLAPGFV
jgi:hypothetical protein